MSAILGAPELNWNVDDANGDGTITLHEYADGKNGAVVATMAGTDEKAVALAILFSEAPALLAAVGYALHAIIMRNTVDKHRSSLADLGRVARAGEWVKCDCRREACMECRLRAALAKAKGEA